MNLRGPVGVLTTSAGAPVSYTEATTTLNTPLIHNNFFMDMIYNIDRERMPERINHGRGTGAFGYFQVTHDISHICKADFLKKVGMKTPVVVRFSQALSERGNMDLVRDIRGFSIKLYTKEGNFDLPCNNIPVYFYNDPNLFVRFLHALKRNPATNLIDPNTIWDLMTLSPEALHSFFMIFSDTGIPAGYRYMSGFALHTYQVENKFGDYHFVRFHITPCSEFKYFTTQEAREIAAEDPDYLTRDLYRSIGNGDFPSWIVSLQILTESDVKKAGSKVFDVTRLLPLKEYPLHQIGKLVLNRNPINQFADVEQLAFCPGNLVPGILGGPDKVFESRVFSYRDTQLYRLGKNFNKIPVNCPSQVRTFTYNRDGRPDVGSNEEDIPNYYPNSFHGPVPYMNKPRAGLISIVEKKADNFDQTNQFYIEMDSGEKSRFLETLVFSLQPVTKVLQQRALDIFKVINRDLAYSVAQGLNITMYK
ncbi:catalase-like [Bicyclus anynana]|uniref:Catalase n=1 Tax=Bicyclus anynana TaxID=110368 RepID=A0ABM3LHN7_BICAN|nr:catalase-like [Bicyclus anynana]